MKAWLKGGVIGVGLAILLLVLIFGFQIFARYLVFGSGEYGKWNDCANSARYQWSHEFRGEGDKIEAKVIEICGQPPEFPHKLTYNLGNNLEHLFLKGDIIMYIPLLSFFVFFFADTPILVIILFFAIGALIGWIVGKIKKPKKNLKEEIV